MSLIFIIYAVLGYLAVPHTIWRNKVIVEFKLGSKFVQQVIYGVVLGWALIPIWLVMKLLGRS